MNSVNWRVSVGLKCVHTPRVSLYPVKGIKDVNLIREFYSRMIATCCSSVKLFILLCIFSKEAACMDFAFKSGFSR